MMTEQTVILSNDEELQSKWKFYIGVACSAVRLVDMFANFYEALYEAFKRISDVLTELFESVKEHFESFDFNNILLWDYDDYPNEFQYNSCRKARPRPHKHYGTYRINTRGFSAPIMKCARSRC